MANFHFGNYKTGSGVISQNGEPTFIAQVIIDKGFDFVTQEYVTETVTVPLGVITDVDLTGAEGVKVKCTPLVNNAFTDAKTGGGSVTIDVPFTPELIEIELTQAQWESSSIARRQFYIRTQVAIKRLFYFGNDVDSNGQPIKTGENSFTGVLTLIGDMNWSTQEYNKKEYPIESGSILEIYLDEEYNSGGIELQIVDGFEFTGVNFPYEATFTNNTVSYSFPDYDYDDIPEDKEELDPNDEMNRYYVANTRPTGGTDPEPSDEPETIANNYLVTKEELAEFNKQVYNISAYEETNNEKTLITEYVSAIRLYPFKLPPDNLYNRGKIKIKRSELNVATIINSDIITVNLGNINIPRTYNNALDFINVKPELILPFCNGSINIDPEYILGSTVNIQMKINIINGATTINLKSDKVDGIFTVSNTTIGSDYPFYNRSNVLQKAFEPNQAINNILTAYVIVESPIYTTSLIKSKKEGLLTDIKGDVIVDDIKLNVLATSEEKAELIALLKNGVFIK